MLEQSTFNEQSGRSLLSFGRYQLTSPGRGDRRRRSTKELMKLDRFV